MKLLQKLSIADWATLTAIGLAVVAFWLLVGHQTNDAIGVLYIAVLLDFLDGKLARRYGSSDFGTILDTLFDVVGYVLFPCVLVFLQWHSAIALLAMVLYGCAAVLRLARFTKEGTRKTGKGVYFEGMPVLYAVIPMALYRLYDTRLTVLVFVIMAPLMISSIKFAKPRNPVFGLLLVAGAGVFLYAG